MGLPWSVVRPSTARVNWWVVLPTRMPSSMTSSPQICGLSLPTRTSSVMRRRSRAVGGPGGAQAGGQVGVGGDRAGDGGGGVLVEQGLAQRLPFGQVAVDGRPGAGADGSHGRRFGHEAQSQIPEPTPGKVLLRHDVNRVGPDLEPADFDPAGDMPSIRFIRHRRRASPAGVWSAVAGASHEFLDKVEVNIEIIVDGDQVGAVARIVQDALGRAGIHAGGEGEGALEMMDIHCVHLRPGCPLASGRHRGKIPRRCIGAVVPDVLSVSGQR